MHPENIEQMPKILLPISLYTHNYTCSCTNFLSFLSFISRHQTFIHDSCSWVYYFVSLFGIIWKLKYLLQGIKCASEDRQMRYDEEVVVPIIDNTPFEADLADSMAQVRWYCIQVYIYILFKYLFTYLLLSIYFPVYIPIWYYNLAIWKMERLGHIS